MFNRFACFCNCNYILFTKLPWPGDSKGTFRFSSQAATCPPVYHTRRRLHTVPLIAERQAGKLRIPIFLVFGLTRPGIEPESTASVADALSTRPLIWSKGYQRGSLGKSYQNSDYLKTSNAKKLSSLKILWDCLFFRIACF